MKRVETFQMAGLAGIFKFTPDYVYNQSSHLVAQNERGIIMDAVTAAEPIGSLPAESRVAAHLSASVDYWEDDDLEVYLAMKGYIAIAEGVIGLLPADKVAKWEQQDES